MNTFYSSQFFTTTHFPFADIFNEKKYVWEILPTIEAYIENLFSKGKVKANYKDRKDVYIGEGTIVHETAEILGPAIIGNNCIISHASFLRGGCILGDNVHIGHAAEIKHSIMLNKSVAAHLNYIGDSIIGNEVNIAGGTLLANYRLDKKTVRVKTQEQVIETGLEKFGAIIGDKSNIGANCVLNPGTILGKESVVYPLIQVKGVHTQAEIIK